MNIGDNGVYIVIFVIVVGQVVYLHFYHRRARELLEKWARLNGYEIVRAEFRLFRKGPFFFRQSTARFPR